MCLYRPVQLHACAGNTSQSFYARISPLWLLNPYQRAQIEWRGPVWVTHVNLKAYQTPKRCTGVYNTQRRDFKTHSGNSFIFRCSDHNVKLAIFSELRHSGHTHTGYNASGSSPAATTEHAVKHYGHCGLDYMSVSSCPTSATGR